MSSLNVNTNRYTVISLFLVILLDTMGFGLIFPILSPLFLDQAHGILHVGTSLDVRKFFYGVTIGAFAICMFIGSVFLGDLSDSLGRKRVLIYCSVGTAIGALLCAVGIEYHSIILLLLGRMLAGLMAGSQPIAQAAIVDISTPQTKAKNIGLISFASSIGFVIGPAFGGYFSDSQIVSWFNFSTPFFCSAGAAILNALMLQLYFKDTYAPLKKKIFFRLSNVLKLFSEAFARPEIKNISIAFFLSELAWALYFQVIPLFLAAVYSTTPSGIGLFMSFVGLLFGMSTMLITRILVGSFPPRSLIITGFFIAGLGMLAPIAATTIGWQWAASLPIIFGMSISYNLLLTLYSNVVGTDEQGWVMGISSSLVAMAWVAGAIVITGLSSFSLWVPFIVAGILEIICAVILLTDV